jgi:hypothetical protein
MHPLEFLEQDGRPEAMRVLLLIVVAVGIVMMWVGRAMNRRGKGIVQLAEAGDALESQRIMDDWGPVGRRAARGSLGIDYVWLLSYSVLLAVACLYIGDLIRAEGWWTGLGRAGYWLAWGALVAGAADAIENTILLVGLSRGATEERARVARVAARLKFYLVFACLLYVAAFRGATLLL